MTSTWIEVTCGHCREDLGATRVSGEFSLFAAHWPVCAGRARESAPAPSPGAVAALARARANRDAERERVKTVRKRRRLVGNSGLASRLDPAAAALLAKLAHPDAGNGGAR